MAVSASTLWSSGASRRRQRLPDDTGISQSGPGDSEHGSGSVSRSRSTSSSTRWSVFSFREAVCQEYEVWSSTARASSVRLQHRRRCCSSMPPVHRGARLRPTILLFAFIVVRRSSNRWHRFARTSRRSTAWTWRSCNASSVSAPLCLAVTPARSGCIEVMPGVCAKHEQFDV